MKHSVILSLVTFISLTVQAQVRILDESSTLWQPCPPCETDSPTGKTTVKWHSTENKHVNGRDSVWIDEIPQRKYRSIINEQTQPISQASLVPFSWQLTEEAGLTVLHCYMRMPADAVTNFWLASEETAIIDLETGTHYRALHCLPMGAWKKYFNFRAQKDNTIDFQIFFPRLAETTRKISIYGVPNWMLRGGEIINLPKFEMSINVYDSTPQMHKPTLVRPASNYNKDDAGSWAAYTDAHLIKPQPEGTMALWRTRDATYLAIAHEQNWMREYYGVEAGGMLLDESGHQYKLKGLQDYPLGQIFWIEGYSGDCTVTVKVYEPIPLHIESITYIEPDGEPFKAWGANWKGTVKHHLSIEELRANQKLFEYHPRDVVTEDTF